MQSITDALGNLVAGIVMMLAGPTVLMYLVRRFVPVLGEELWRSYCRLLMWMLRAPFHVVRFLVREIVAAHRRR